MAADDADAVSTSDRTARLAQILGDIETEDTEVVDYDTNVKHDDTLWATIEVKIDEGRRPEDTTHRFRPADATLTWSVSDEEPEEGDAEEIVDGLEEEAREAPRELLSVSGVGERKARLLAGNGYQTIDDLEAATQSELTEVSRVGNALAARIKADVGGADVPDHLEDGEQHEVRSDDGHPYDEIEACDADHSKLPGGEECPDCDYVAPLPGPAESEDNQEDVDEQGDGGDSTDYQAAEDLQDALDESEAADEDDDLPEEDSLAAEVLATLREEGELSGPDLKTITGSRSEIYTAISELEADGLIEKRDDPDDGRRTLYSAVDWVVDDEEEQDDGPEWNGRDPEAIVADSSLPARVVLEDILDAVASADTLIEAAEDLDVDIDNLEPVCWELTLKQPESYEVVDDVDEQAEKIREVAA